MFYSIFSFRLNRFGEVLLRLRRLSVEKLLQKSNLSRPNLQKSEDFQECSLCRVSLNVISKMGLNETSIMAGSGWRHYFSNQKKLKPSRKVPLFIHKGIRPNHKHYQHIQAFQQSSRRFLCSSSCKKAYNPYIATRATDTGFTIKQHQSQ